MTSFDASALTADPEGSALLRQMLGAGQIRTCQLLGDRAAGRAESPISYAPRARQPSLVAGCANRTASALID